MCKKGALLSRTTLLQISLSIKDLYRAPLHVLPLPHRIHTDTERPTATATRNAKPSRPPLPLAADWAWAAVATEEEEEEEAGVGGVALPEHGCRGGPHSAEFPL